jgi:beta-lactamase regulating signal transducer with metallopeptidase domain
MNGAMQGLLSAPWVHRVGWALVHSLWQGAGLAAGVAALLGCLRGRSPQARWAAAAAGLGLMVVVPLVTAFAVNVSPAGPAGMPVRSSGVTAAGPAGRVAATGAARVPFEASPRAAGPIAVPPVSRSVPWWESARRGIEPVLPWAVMVWFAGVAALSAWHLGGWWHLLRSSRHGARPASAGVGDAFRDMAGRLRISRPIRLLESACVAVPVVVGWVRPVVLLPAAAVTGLTGEELAAVLAHELAHVRRHDCAVRAVQAVVETLLFYHPASWWLSGRVNHYAEECCDEIALGVCGDRRLYVGALEATARLARRTGPAPAATGGGLLARVRRIAGAPRGGHIVSSRWPAAAVALAVAAAGLPWLASERFGLNPGPASVTITMSAENDAPAAGDDAYGVDEDNTLNVSAPGVLSDDSDVNGDTLTVSTTPVRDVTDGTLTLGSDGSFTYAPDRDFFGTDSFVYQVSDGNGGTDMATVTITVNPVNDPPVAVDDGRPVSPAGRAQVGPASAGRSRGTAGAGGQALEPAPATDADATGELAAALRQAEQRVTSFSCSATVQIISARDATPTLRANPGSARWDSTPLVHHVEWAFVGSPHEGLVYRSDEGVLEWVKDGLHPERLDYIHQISRQAFDGEHQTWLEGNERKPWDSPGEVSAEPQFAYTGGIKAGRPAPPEPWVGGCPQWFSLWAAGPPLSRCLEDGTARYVGTEEVDGSPMQIVDVSVDLSEEFECACRIWLDPARGFATTRLQFVTDGQPMGWGDTLSVHLAEWAPGLWFPREVIAWQGSLTHTVVTEAAFNEPIAPSRFTIEFPAGTDVADERDGPVLEAERPPLTPEEQARNRAWMLFVACMTYAWGHYDAWPDDLAALVAEGYVDASELRNPRWPEREVGYAYRRPDHDAPGETIVLWEAYETWPKDGVWAVRKDSAAWRATSEEELHELLAAGHADEGRDSSYRAAPTGPQVEVIVELLEAAEEQERLLARPQWVAWDGQTVALEIVAPADDHGAPVGDWWEVTPVVQKADPSLIAVTVKCRRAERKGVVRAAGGVEVPLVEAEEWQVRLLLTDGEPRTIDIVPKDAAAPLRRLRATARVLPPGEEVVLPSGGAGGARARQRTGVAAAREPSAPEAAEAVDGAQIDVEFRLFVVVQGEDRPGIWGAGRTSAARTLRFDPGEDWVVTGDGTPDDPLPQLSRRVATGDRLEITPVIQVVDPAAVAVTVRYSHADEKGVLRGALAVDVPVVVAEEWQAELLLEDGKPETLEFVRDDEGELLRRLRITARVVPQDAGVPDDETEER